MRWLCIIPLSILTLLVLGVVCALVFSLSPGGIISAVGSSEILFALRFSLITSLSAAAAACALGVPAGYVLARQRFPGKGILDTFLDIPLVMTPLIAGVGLVFLFGEQGLGGILGQWGIRVLFTPLGAVVAQLFVAAPIVTRSSRAAFEGVSLKYEWAGQSLGLTPGRVFFRITLPMARNGVLSGLVLAWARAVGEFGATLMLAGATRFRTETLPIAVFLNINSGELDAAVASAWILMITGFSVVVLLKGIGDSRADAMLGKDR